MGKIKRIVFEYENGTMLYEDAAAESAKSQIDSAFTLAHIHGFKYSPPTPTIIMNTEKD